MEETARYLAARVNGKSIILTGAMVPYKFGSSDGLFNLGSAIAYAQVLPAGIYVAMNGQYFAWNNVRKNRKKGVFEARTKNHTKDHTKDHTKGHTKGHTEGNKV
jgi:L-asparaginase